MNDALIADLSGPSEDPVRRLQRGRSATPLTAILNEVRANVSLMKRKERETVRDKSQR